MLLSTDHTDRNGNCAVEVKNWLRADWLQFHFNVLWSMWHSRRLSSSAVGVPGKWQRYDDFNTQSRGFELLRELLIRLIIQCIKVHKHLTSRRPPRAIVPVPESRQVNWLIGSGIMAYNYKQCQYVWLSNRFPIHVVLIYCKPWHVMWQITPDCRLGYLWCYTYVSNAIITFCIFRYFGTLFHRKPS